MSPARLLAACFAVLLLAAAPAYAASPTLVVSQVYAGGGNSGATFTNDYVELFNRGGTAVDLAGWTVQYATATGTSWSATALSGTVQPGKRYLVQFASSASIGAALPTPDATGTTNLALTGGKVALVHDASALGCGASAGSCSAVASVQDLVGYGSATDFEGSAASALTSSTAGIRAGGGCTDTDANASDFATGAPSPSNSSAAAAPCAGSGPTTPTASQGASVDVDVQSVLSISLERPTVSFGAAASGETPSPVSQQVTVVSNNPTGYSLTVHRTAFSPADLPLGLSASAPPGATLGAGLTGGGLVAIPIAPALDLLIGQTSAKSVAGGDVWPTSIGFTGPLPVVPSGRYTATVTYTVVAR